MATWLKEVRDADKIALAILLLGVLITATATGAYLGVLFHHGLQEAEIDRADSVIKDFFEVGTGLIGAALLALKLQPKPDQPNPPAELPKP
jgi:hypothetical protein